MTGKEKGKLRWGLGRLGAHIAAFTFLWLPVPVYLETFIRPCLGQTRITQFSTEECLVWGPPEHDLNPQRPIPGRGSQALKTSWQQAVSKGISSGSEPGIRAPPSPPLPCHSFYVGLDSTAKRGLTSRTAQRSVRHVLLCTQ